MASLKDACGRLPKRIKLSESSDGALPLRNTSFSFLFELPLVTDFIRAPEETPIVYRRRDSDNRSDKNAFALGGSSLLVTRREDAAESQRLEVLEKHKPKKGRPTKRAIRCCAICAYDPRVRSRRLHFGKHFANARYLGHKA
jgi:hypothetical protein